MPLDDVVMECWRFAGFTLDVPGRMLTDSTGREVSLWRSEFALLLAFIHAPGRVLSRDHLLDAVAGRRAEAFDRSIDVLVGRLRHKIEPEPKTPHLILTVPGIGYKFAAEPHAVVAKVEQGPETAIVIGHVGYQPAPEHDDAEPTIDAGLTEISDKPPPPGVLALLTDPKGRVLVSVADFELFASGGPLLEAQTWRVKHRLAVKLVKNFCPSWLAAALDDYRCGEIVDHLLSNQGFVRTIIPIGHSDDMGKTKRIRLVTHR